MAAYEALYRKWRPQSFDDIVAQPHITRTLKNQIMREKTAHAYLFTGSRGTGKTTCARIFAKAVNCLNPKDGCPCLECEICRDAEAGTLTDIIEIDGASNNSVEEVRSLRDSAAFSPVRCKYKIYIIDEVHMMSTGAFNALLKIIEEPPPYVKFVFATTEIHKVPATILSRCQRFDFRRILPADIAARIQYIASHEAFTVSDAAAYRIAALSDGGMRDALSLLDQCAAVSDEIGTETVEEAVGVAGTESVYEIIRAIAARDSAAALHCIDRLYAQSKDMTRFADEISQQLRSMMICRAAPNDPSLLSMMPDDLNAVRELAGLYSMRGVLETLNAVRQCCDRMTRAGNRRMELEMTLIRLCTEKQQADAPSDSTLTARIAALEQKLAQVMENGVPAANQSAPRPAAPQKRVQRTVTAPDDIAPVQNWDQIVEQIGDSYPPGMALLKDNSRGYITRKMQTIFIRGNDDTLEYFRKNTDRLRAVIREIFGAGYDIRLPRQSEMPETQGKAVPAAAPVQQPSPLDQALKRLSDAGVPIVTDDSDGLV